MTKLEKQFSVDEPPERLYQVISNPESSPTRALFVNTVISDGPKTHSEHKVDKMKAESETEVTKRHDNQIYALHQTTVLSKSGGARFEIRPSNLRAKAKSSFPLSSSRDWRGEEGNRARTKRSIPRAGTASRLMIALLLLSVTWGLVGTGHVKAEALMWSATSNPSGGDDTAYGIAADSSGVYTVGYDSFNYPQTQDLEWRIEKRSLADGSLLWSVTNNPSVGNDVAFDVAVDGSGVYIVGNDLSNGYPDTEWRIEKRSLTDGSLLWTSTSNPTTGFDDALGVAVDGSGVYIAGAQNYDQWRVEKRNLADGSVLWTATSDPSTGNDFASNVAVDSSGVYTVGSVDGNARAGLEKRSLSDGSLLWSAAVTEFCCGGVAVAVHSTGVFMVGFDRSSGWGVQKRSLADGSQIWSAAIFVGGGSASGLALDDSGVYAAGFAVSGNPPNNQYAWRSEKRALADGSLLWEVAESHGGGFQEATGVAVDASGVYIDGFETGEWRIEKRDLPDVTPPETTIRSVIDGDGVPVANEGWTFSPSATFTFSGTDNVGISGFECSLDGSAFATCQTPSGYQGLSTRHHTFQVRAVDPSGNVDPTPATFGWTVARRVRIDIVPGDPNNVINLRSKGKIPVAILSSSGFDAPSMVDRASLTFGRTGNEQSLAFCDAKAADVNKDGLKDQVCYFDTRAAGFQVGDTIGILRGRLSDGTPIQGIDSVRVKG